MIAARLTTITAMLTLAGCTTATVALPDGTRVQFTRFATDAAVHVGPDAIDYSSSPSAAAQQQVTDALVGALGVLVATGGAPRTQSLPARLRSPEPAMFGGYGS